MSKLIVSFLVAILTFAIAVVATTQNVSAQNSVNGYLAGVETGTASAAVSKTIGTSNADKLSFILTASGGNFGSKFGLVSVSVDGTNFILVDNVTLSTNTLVAKNYSDTTLASTVAVNPAMFPFVKIATSAGNTGVTEKITFVVQQSQ